MPNIKIDKNSGFCMGVVKAIQKAEVELQNGETLYCLGDIVHNGQEMERLAKMGLITINHEEFEKLHNVKVLLRAHGEPPSTYEIAKKNNITLIDASCPVVLALQRRIKKAYEESPNKTQIVIYGKKGHAEVNGLVGQTHDEAIVIENEDDLNKLDFSKDIFFFSQTTKSLDGFKDLVQKISAKMEDGATFKYSDTICHHVSKRMPNIIKFASENDIILFVSGKKSSNGKELYEKCRMKNPNTFFISAPGDMDDLKLDLTQKIGICGATSTPAWLMEAVAEKIKEKKD
ncbi:4-hydroxy-3-methylbut-2-enyl diphosphate reductase [Paludibacter sp. 221]|uniref:4-hydroxy-3-methylbut-2-enyl diphosphate reductase n=1 Tax=Paludibacter sp. 221 TaxID=2302939 RepID=UPI0013D8B904|nr:4-hydroxy-3-methylbut-2-enyl diphosphate reductase [Paludibacter sp. 221]NDV47116.1 4-hydroxy-3-methylbut-2-enyl diphosphate reductase [Paludibacter sp. 221]